MHFGASEVWLHAAPVAFDASTLEIWGALLHGSKLVLAPPHSLSLEELGAVLSREKVSSLWLTAALFEQMVAHQPVALSGVRQLLAGGDVLPPHRVREHLARLPEGHVLVNGYGPTENTTFSATHSLRHGDEVSRSVPIGSPLSNSSAFVLDSSFQPLPPGVPGELFVGGDGLAWGYLNRADLTAERFVPHPFSSAPGARLYRTGDKARWLSDGTLEFLGRNDFQVKIRGFRIELGEVEAALRLFSGIQEAVVLAREDVPGDKRLVAYFTAAEEQSVDTTSLKGFLQQRLPEYMVPSAFVSLTAFPLSANGKLDRKALPAPDFASAASADEFVEPSTPAQARLASIFADVLGLERVSLHGDFFELGGHSLLATQVVSRIRSAFSVELPLGELFAAPTVALLAQRLEQHGSASRQPPLVPVDRSQPLPLSFAQQRLWFLDQLQPGSSTYNIPWVLKLSGALDSSALLKSLQALTQRHEVLRTHFSIHDGQPVQVIQPDFMLEMPVIDLSALPAQEREAEAQRLASQEAVRPFDLARGPVVRASLVRLDAREHRLLVTIHHIASDGWSISVMVRELAAFYRQFSGNEPTQLAPLPIQYADFSVWQRQWLHGDVLEKELGWWRTQLAGAPAAIELPTDRPRPAVQTYNGAVLPFTLSTELTQAVKALAQRENATPFMVLLAGWQVLLSRYSRQDDISVGSPIANRNRSETEGLIGFFVNTLVHRARINPEHSFRELLTHTRASTLAAFEHQDIPFEKLVEELQPQRDLSRSPLFQVSFVYQNTPDEDLDLPGLELDVLTSELHSAKFDLFLGMSEVGGKLQGALDYNSDLFDVSTVERMARHFTSLLTEATTHVDQPLHSLKLLSATETQILLSDFQGEHVRYPEDATLHSLFEAQALRTPHAEALRFEGTSLSYAQLDARSNQLAHHLRSLGARPGLLVAVCLERSLDLVVSLLAVLKSGAAYVPLDPAYPRERLAGMLEDAQAPVLLTHSRLTSVLPQHASQVLCLDTQWDAVSRQSSASASPLAGPDSLAYVIFTSGSTGRPKGAMNAHSGVVNRLLWMQQQYSLTALDTVLQKTPFSFDVSVWEFFWPLLTGARLILARPGGHQDPAYLVRLLSDERVSTVHFVPSMLRAFLEEPGLDSLNHLRRVLCSGEALPADLVHRAHSRLHPSSELHNLYGPTEAAVDVSFFHCARGSSLSSIPIGRPVANTRLYVLDSQGQPAPVGVPGELFIGGVQVGLGYWRSPHLTAERFIPDAFSDSPGARLYRTGDLARWLPDGTLEYLGRSDFQVKLRGFRIELGEVENALLAHPSVRDAIVTVREDVAGDARLVAYVTGDAESLTQAQLRAHLEPRLPEYMVPSVFMHLASMPLTPSGKADRKALPAPERLATAREYTAPRTPTEQLLASLFASVLHVERVGVTDSFFELGGHSLLATQLVSRVRQSFGVELPVRALFEASAVAQLATRIESARQERHGLQLPPLAPVPRTGELPLSFAQQRLWFLDKLQPDSPFYNIPSALQLDGALDTEALTRALRELVRRHESLRTSFHTREDGEPVQRIHPDATLSVSVVDLGQLPEQAREAEAQKLATLEIQKPFDLTRAPLVRATLLRLSEQRHVLLVTVHHIVSDGWSSGIFGREVGELYAAFSRGLPSPLAPLSLQYADYAAWQRGWLRDDVLAQQVSWWREHLSGAPHALELPTDRPRPAVQSAHGANLPVRLGAALTTALRTLCQREGVTPFMVLLSALNVLLARYSGQDDIVVGSPIANRQRAELEGIIGFFVNTLALRTRTRMDMTFRELLTQVRESTLAAYEHQDVPFEKLVEELQPQRDLSRSPLFQAMLGLQTARAEGVPAGAPRSLEVDSGTAKFDLSLLLVDTGDDIHGLLEFNTDLFDRSTAQRMGEHLTRLLASAVSDTNQSLARLPLLSTDERQQLLTEWNDTAHAPHVPVAIHHPVEAQAARTPEAIAVSDGTTALTYAQLDARANQLAHVLRQHGVFAGATVGICLEKSLDMAVAVLATLKAGAAYLPLDPNYPAERLAFMLEDSGTRVVLSHSSLRDSLPVAGSVRNLLLDIEAEAITAKPTHALTVTLSPDAPAYVIYTSGSTGRPKGVALPHRALSNLFTWQLRQSRKPQATTLQFASLSFDVSCQELFSTWWAGGTLVLPMGGLRQDVPALLDFIQAQGVERLFLPFVALQAIADAVAHGATLPESLREVVTAGEQLQVTPALVALFERLPGCVLENQYGPSETHVVSAHRLQGAPASWPRLPSIGAPLPHTQLFVLDAMGQPTPIGVPGELHIGGEHLALGYPGRPELTAEKFVPHPFSKAPGARLYRTGDSARWKADGTVEFLGRLDGQVKLRGFRVELGEVEASLRALPGIRDAAAVVREDVPGDKRLVGYVVPTEESGAALTPNALRSALLGQLPEYMVPSVFLTLDALPLTPSGKIARRLLPAPDAESLRGDATFIAPRTPAEEKLAELFAAVLKLPRVGATDSFFALGGHSLLATQVVSRIRAAFSVELPLRELFEAPTVAGLAERLEQYAAETKVPPLVPADRSRPLPLSFAQQRLWFLDKLQPDSPTFNMPIALRLEGVVDVEALRQAITELVRRHEVLRTTFQEGPVQVIHAPAPVPMPVEDLSSLTGEAREAEVQRRVLAEAKRPFDLGRGPVLRASLLRLEATQHVLMLTLHHIATDGWSMGLLVRESTELYAAFVTGQPARLPELPIQYADYAAWQRDWLQGDALEAQLSWWRTHLSGAAPQLDLPTDFPRPVVQGFQGAMVGRVLPRSLVDSLQALCREEGSTLFMALLAGFQVVLSRYSGQEDFVLGTDIANRNRAETEGLIGFFINQLALRARLGGDPSFRELLSRVKTDTLGAYAHQDLPFEELVKDLNPGRGLGFAPLFQVKLVLQNQPDTELEVPGLTFRPLGSGTGTARLDLTLSITESAHGLSCSAEYRTDLFTAETIDGLIRHLGNVLEAATTKPSARISSLPLMRQEEQQRVLVEWNDSARDFPREATAHSLFEAQARRTPEAEALRFEGESLTFAQLDSRANQLAHHLRSLGVRPEVPVALCLERSLDLVVSMLAILKAGGAWVPLDPSYPVERLSFILRDCSAPVLLTTESLADELPVSTQQLVLLDSDSRFISRQPTSAPDSGAVADNLAYVIYTSGSTGTPKGTLLQHRGFSNTALAAGRRHGFSPASRVLQFASFSFDASVAEIFGALLAGSTLVLAPRERLMPGAPLRDLLRDESISAVTLTPSVLAQLNPEDFPSLSTLISAGEACPPELVSRWGSRVRLLNAYGPTEVTVCASISQPLLPGQTPSIGTPWDNVRLFILDASLRPLPVGVPGQLCIDSVGLARGYLHRADLTAERFVPNPFSEVPGARLYLTGDKARWLPDGTLEFLGRLDSQVKLRGFRIELGEVEAALLLHPSVSQAVASIRTEASGDKRLVAYVVGEDVDVSVLRDSLKLRLPEHMVPSAIAQLDALPLTPNGKVDRDALPSPDASIAAPVREYVAPRTPTEIRLAALWAELLHVERVGLTDDFFELGGHSLLATQSLSRLQATFGIEVPLRELFEAPTVEKLAARVEVLVQAGATTPRAPELTPVARTGNLPLSFAQRRLWFLDQLEPGTALYNLPAAIRLEGAVEVSALEQAFAALVRRHEALRTTFPANADGSPHQAIAEEATLNVALVDLSTLPSAQREEAARRLALTEARKPFDLARGPLLRVTLLRLDERLHVLLLTMHHIVSDGWSTGVLVREAAELYSAAREGRTASLPTLRVQYADHAAWQHQWLGAGELERQLTYWKTQLAGANHVLALPTDRPVPPMQTQAGATHPVRLSPEVSSAVAALGQQLGATPFMVVLAAFQAFLYRVTGQDDVLVGSPVAGRNRPETEGLIGVFINTLVLRGQMSGAMSFRALVEQAREAALGALTHQDVPFEHLVEELQPARSLSHSPLFQVMFALQNTPVPSLTLPELSLTPADVDPGIAKYSLSLVLQETPAGLMGGFEYNTDLFDARTLEAMTGQFTRLLEAAVSTPDVSLAALPLLSTEERHQLLVQWNDTRSDLPRDSSVFTWFQARAAKSPDAVALEWTGGTLTYRELERRALALAEQLRQRNVGPEVRVGLFARRSPELVIGVLGVLAAGGVWVPLDPSSPSERLGMMLEDTTPAVVLTQRALRTALPSTRTVLVLEDLVGADAVASSTFTAPGLASENAAYVLFTSGSTGRPKGVVVPHRALARHTAWFTKSLGLGPADRMLQKTAPGFDAVVPELLSTLASGATLVLPPSSADLDMDALLSVLANQRVTVLQLVPSQLRLLVESERLERASGLRVLVSGGEALSAELARRVRTQWPETRLANCYGPTETTVDATSWTVSGDIQGATAPIGGPIADTRVYVLDAHGQPVPVGVTGELFIGGEGVARGYIGQAAMTAERFVPDAFSSVPGARLYATGDQVRWRRDGVLEFLGRADDQVKVRGFRIELAEIESALLAHPEVREAVVLVREDRPGDRRIVGYVVAPASLDTAALRTFVAQRLPEYMVPSSLRVLEALPLTSNGKVDRKALPVPEQTGSFTDDAQVAPGTPTEELLAGLFAQVLGVSRVSTTASFFELGGHSLLATQLVSRVRSAFQVDLPLRDLFESPTVQALAQRIDTALSTGARLQRPPLTALPREGAAPRAFVQSFAQQRLWFLDQLDPGSPAYNMPIALRLEGVVDTRALERAFTEMVRRHESLRTTFRAGPEQVVHAPSPVTVPVVEVSSLDEDQVQRWVDEEARRPFDLARGPLLRAKLLRLGEQRHILLLTMHHIVSDGWSMGVLVRETAALYAAFRAGQPSPLPELSIQYADYAAWQRAWLQGEALEAQVSWWKEHLSGAPPLLELPTDFPRPARQGFGGALVSRVLPRSLVESLQALCRREGSTLFMALMAGLQAVLSRYSGQEDFVVGTGIANRHEAETEDLIGFFINQLPLRARLGGNPSFRELLSRVRKDTLGAYAHQDLPFEEVVKAVNPERNPAHAPLFQVALVLQNQPDSELKLPDLTFHLQPANTGTSRLDLTLSAAETAQGLSFGVEYRTDLFTAETVDALIRHLGVLLEKAVERPEAPVASLSMLTEAEQQRVLVEWNDSARDFPREATAHSLFEAQARRTPEAEALRFEGESLTFAQLDSRANQLAHHLRSLGVRPEVPVALCLERSLDLVVSMLAILKAGGAWVPLDPTYPAERLSFILRDCSAPVLLTTEALAKRLPVSTQRRVLIDSEAAKIAAQSTSAPDSGAVADNLAYVIYTSGSTGTPKGTLLQHRGFSNTALAAGRRHGFSPASRVLQFASFNFDASVAEIFGALLAGSTLVLAPRERLMPGAPLRDLLRDESISAVTLTPSVLAQLHPEDFPSLSTLISAGEACPPELVSRWGSRVRLLNAYGPTEITVCASISEPLLPGQTPSIGTPWDNVRLFILDASLRPLPVGVPGQLCIDSVGLARGYLHRADLTAERFVPNPFSLVPGARLYLTGDKARWLPNGTLEFLGRLDSQVKLRGFRIELGEVEAALLLHPSVSQAVASIRTEASGDKRLVAYVVGEDVDVSVLRDFLKLRLPEHMVPSAIAQLDALPLTPNGKVDRDALPALDTQASARDYVAPRTPTEIRLAALWAELLHVERVGLTDDFFELGGHSLLATQLVSRIRASFGVELALRDLFSVPTIEALAQRVDEAILAGKSVQLPPLVPVSRENGPLPLSFAQQRLWFLDRFQPDSAFYNIPSALRLDTVVDLDALIRALQELVQRHEALRTSFHTHEDGEPYQHVHPRVELAVPVVDLSRMPESAREAEALKLATAEAQKPFDLTRVPLLRTTLLKLAPEQHVLLVTVHHIVSDGWSSGILSREVGALYSAFSQGLPSPLAPLPLQYADYAAWQRGWLRDETLAAQVGWWSQNLSGVPHALELPTDRPRPPVQTSHGAS
ncbi:non-ribosomal peptide synthase/polyketide synthase, partial [Myxococcus fulvus]|nr:non-ribosomal peptide synthase/polyketide synthase [Myxococcus fulvus]